MYARRESAARAKRSSGQRGMAIAELAMIIPAFLLMFMGVIEVGNLFMSWLTVQKAAQVGTRFAVTGQGELEGDRLQRIRAASEEMLDALGNGTGNVDICSWPGKQAIGSGRQNNAGKPCQLMQVTVQYDYSPLTPLPAVMAMIADVFGGSGGGDTAVTLEEDQQAAADDEGVSAPQPDAPQGSFPDVIRLTGRDQKINEPWLPCEEETS